jgi:hypothetical protein
VSTKGQLRACVINPESPLDLYQDVIITKNDCMGFSHKNLGDKVSASTVREGICWQVGTLARGDVTL